MSRQHGTHTKKSDEIKIYDYDLRISRKYEQIRSDLSPRTFELITEYDKTMISGSASKTTRSKHLDCLYILSKFLSLEWENATKKDIDNIVVKIMHRYADDTGQESHTTRDLKKVLKIFFRWLKLGSRNFNEVGNPAEIRDVRLRNVKDRISREDLLTESDISQLLKSCRENQRDRAFIHVHAEAGTRPGEILNLKIKHVLFDKNGAIIKVDGKTGSRQIRLIESVPNLSTWINMHAQKENPDAPLWPNYDKSAAPYLTYSAANKMLERRATSVGITKKINLKLFRHSRATFLANVLTEPQMRERHGWTKDSKMPSRYVHLINADVDKAMLKHYGIEKNYDITESRAPKTCYICQMPNSFDSKLCSRCGKPLDTQTAIDADSQREEEMKKLVESDSIKEKRITILEEKFEEIKILLKQAQQARR